MKKSLLPLTFLFATTFLSAQTVQQNTSSVANMVNPANVVTQAKLNPSATQTVPAHSANVNTLAVHNAPPNTGNAVASPMPAIPPAKTNNKPAGTVAPQQPKASNTNLKQVN